MIKLTEVTDTEQNNTAQRKKESDSSTNERSSNVQGLSTKYTQAWHAFVIVKVYYNTGNVCRVKHFWRIHTATNKQWLPQ